jgi:hypothetical protein
MERDDYQIMLENIKFGKYENGKVIDLNKLTKKELVKKVEELSKTLFEIYFPPKQSNLVKMFNDNFNNPKHHLIDSILKLTNKKQG